MQTGTTATAETAVNRETIASIYQLIRPYIRRTPIVEVDGAEFGIAGARLILKLELLQHSGSFKPRGAFANMLTREVPAAGVVAASGGNHGAAVAYVARQLGKLAAVIGRQRDAASHFHRALEVHTQLKAPVLIAHTQLDHAEALGRGPRAARMIDEAADTAAELDLPAVAGRVERLRAS